MKENTTSKPNSKQQKNLTDLSSKNTVVKLNPITINAAAIELSSSSSSNLTTMKLQGLLSLPNDLLVNIIGFLNLDSINSMENVNNYLQQRFHKSLWNILCKSQYSYREDIPDQYFGSYGQIFRILYLNRNSPLGVVKTIEGPAIPMNVLFIRMILDNSIYFQDGFSKILTEDIMPGGLIPISTLFVSFQEGSHTLWLTEILLYQTLQYSLYYNFQSENATLMGYKINLFEKQYLTVQGQESNNGAKYLYIFDLLNQNTSESFGNLQPLVKYKFKNRNGTGNAKLQKDGKYDYSIINSIDFDNITLISKSDNNFWYLLLESNKNGSCFMEIECPNLHLSSVKLEVNQSFLKFISEHSILAIVDYNEKIIVFKKISQTALEKMVAINLDLIFSDASIPSIIETKDSIYLILFNRIVILSYDLEIVTSISKPEFCTKWVFNWSNVTKMIDCFLEAENEFCTYYCKLTKEEFNMNLLENIYQNSIRIPYKSNMTIFNDPNSLNEFIQIEFSTISKIEKIGYNSYFYVYKKYCRSYQQDHIVIDFFKLDHNKMFSPLIDFMLICDKVKFNMIENDGKLGFISKENKRLEQFFDLKTSIQIVPNHIQSVIFAVA